MAKRFGRNLENPEGRITNEGNEGNELNDTLEGLNDDGFEKKLDEFKRLNKFYKLSKDDNHIADLFDSEKKEFMQRIKVEQHESDTPISLAYQELDRARKSRNREEIIRAEDRILDLEREEEEKNTHQELQELEQRQKKAIESGDKQELDRVERRRKRFIIEMKYDELNYKIKKLQNSQRLSPSKEKIQQIMELKNKLETLEHDGVSK